MRDIDDPANNTCDGITTATGINIRNSIFAGNQVLGYFASGAGGDLGAGTDPTTCGPYTGSAAADVVTLLLQDAANGNQINPAGFGFRGDLQFDRGQAADYRISPTFAGTTTGSLPPAGYFDQVNFIGAVSPSSSIAPFYEGWSRGWQSPTTP